MEKFVINKTTNALLKYNHHMPPELLYHLIIPHQHNGQWIDYIGHHCFNGLVIPFLCIEDSMEYLENSACENAEKIKDWQRMFYKQ